VVLERSKKKVISGNFGKSSSSVDNGAKYREGGGCFQRGNQGLEVKIDYRIREWP